MDSGRTARTPNTIDPLVTLLHTAENSLTISDIAETGLQFVHPKWSAARALTWLERNNFDVAPVREEPPNRYINRVHLVGQGGKVGELATLIDAIHVVSASCGLAEGISLLSSSDFFFVIDGHRLAGITTLADLQKIPVSMVTLAMILTAEAGMSRLIQRDYGTSWFENLSSQRQKRIDQIFIERQRSNSEITRLESLMLEDRLTLIGKQTQLVYDLGFSSKQKFKRWGERLRRLRDMLAHGGNLLHAEHDPKVAAGLFSEVRNFAERVWSLHG